MDSPEEEPQSRNQLEINTKKNSLFMTYFETVFIFAASLYTKRVDAFTKQYTTMNYIRNNSKQLAPI